MLPLILTLAALYIIQMGFVFVAFICDFDKAQYWRAFQSRREFWIAWIPFKLLFVGIYQITGGIISHYKSMPPK